MDISLILIGLAWFAILAMLAGGAVMALQRLVRRPERALFFGRLERHGLTLVQAERDAGFWNLGQMAARCASCTTRNACRRALRWGSAGFALPPCPNKPFFVRMGASKS